MPLASCKHAAACPLGHVLERGDGLQFLPRRSHEVLLPPFSTYSFITPSRLFSFGTHGILGLHRYVFC